MAIQNYAQVDVSGKVINAVSWDGVSNFPQPAGITLVQSDVAARGDAYINGQFVKAAPEEDKPAPLKIEDRLTALEAEIKTLKEAGK